MPETLPSRGGGGGTGFLIVATLFIGYLYVSKRLNGVIMAIRLPMVMNGGTGAGLVPAPVLPPLSTVPIVPSSNSYSYGGQRSFTIAFPPQYNAAPVSIQAGDAATCRQLVYQETYRATGSMTLAATYAAIYC